MHVKALHKTHMTDTHYLQCFFRKSKSSIEDYDGFCSKLYDTSPSVSEYIDDTWENMAIDLLPYLYTVRKTNKKDFKSFLIFYCQYAKHAGIDAVSIEKYLCNQSASPSKDSNESNDHFDVFLDIIQKDKVSLVGILIVMQYYFL